MIKKEKNLTPVLWILALIFSMGGIFTNSLLPEKPWVSWILFGLLVATFATMIFLHRKQMRKQTLAHGANALASSLIWLAILVVFNVFAVRYPKTWDLTKNKINTFSPQTEKVVKELDQDLEATFYFTSQQDENFKPLLSRLKNLSPKFKVEYVDFIREPSRVQSAGVVSPQTLHLKLGNKEARIQDPDEEKITNELIKMTRKDAKTVCFLSGHEELSISGQDEMGLSFLKSGLESQSYQSQEVALYQSGEIPSSCNSIAILGPKKPLFPKEIELLDSYLQAGGRLMVAVDLNFRGGEYSSELIQFLKKWGLQVDPKLIVDLTSTLNNMDASVPIIPTFNTTEAPAKAFNDRPNAIFPIARPVSPLENTKIKNWSVTWLAQTTPQAWGESDIQGIANKKGVKFNADSDSKGPLTVAALGKGKLDEKQNFESRLVVFGTSQFMTNQISRYGVNLDLALNTLSWLSGDESVISIRKKEQDPSRIELSTKAGQAIYQLAVLVVPGLIFFTGIGVWFYRRKL